MLVASKKEKYKNKTQQKNKKNCASFWFFTLLGRAVSVVVAVAVAVAAVVAVAVSVRTSSHCQDM